MNGQHPKATRLGVIGCGAIAYWKHLRNAGRLRGAALVSIADPDRAARERAEKLTGVRASSSNEELLARGDVDAVIVAVPPHLHAEVVVAACEAGKHVYVEKPLAASVAEGARIVDAARRAGITVMVGFNRRYHPLSEQARKLLSAGRVGRIHAVQTIFCEPAVPEAMPAWKRNRTSGGGVLLDLASHHVDLLRWFLDDEVATVYASVESSASDQDSARLEMTMRGGVQVQCFFSCRAATSEAFEFVGESGILRLDRHRRHVSLRVPRRFGYGVRIAPILPSASVGTLSVKRLARPSADPSYRRALGAFVDVLRGEAVQVPDLEDGMRALEVVETAEESARRRAPLEINGRAGATM